MSPISTIDAFYHKNYDPNTQLCFTKHCLTVPCEDGKLLYNTQTGALVLLEKNETVEELRNELIRLRFFVDSKFDELKFSRDLRTILTLSMSGENLIKSYTIFTTTFCNARCFYCYENGIRRFSMSEKTAIDTADFIIKSCKGNKVSLHWFGGEPLLNHRAISIICKKLNDNGIPYKSKIITNGYLFDDSLTDEAKNLWHLKNAHITLDGTKEVYQNTKAYINGDKNAFERVNDNIDLLLSKGISVSVRLNLNRENYEDILMLCDYLGNRFGKKNGISVVPVLLRQYENDVKQFESEDLSLKCYSSVQEKLEKIGLLKVSQLESKYRCTSCMADSDTCIVVYPDGKLGKCEHFDEKEIIGSIYENKFDYDKISMWKKIKEDVPLCADCPIYPQCNQLKKCPNTRGECTSAIRQQRINNLKKRILKTYTDIVKQRY